MENRATARGTAAYAERTLGWAARFHFRQAQQLWLSSIGLGTYLGNYDAETDAAYRAAALEALQGGCNVIDTAINYRFQRSERVIGEVLAELFASGELRREEVFVATKGGFLAFDAAPPDEPWSWFEETYVATGVATPADVAAGAHCMTPRFLHDQVGRSLHNLRLQQVDLYYLHNPETQLAEVSRPELVRRLLAAFAALEEEVGEGRIGWYGVATWSGLRQERGARDYLSLEELVNLAEQVGGSEHHLRFVQLPFNLAMHEAWSARNQPLGRARISCLEAAQRLGITVMVSASMLQGQLGRRLPGDLGALVPELKTDAQRAIQFARSAPGVTTALVGMKSVEHVRENLAVARSAPLDQAAFDRVLG